MSRVISDVTHHMTDIDKAQRDTSSGKIIFTQYSGHSCAFFIRENRLIAAKSFVETTNQIGAVYVGKVKKHVKNINAYFVEIAEDQICFLSEKDAKCPIVFNRTFDGRLKEGDEVLVQISKDAVKTKQAVVTTEITLSNEYAVLTTGNNNIGISTKISKDKRNRLREWTNDLKLPLYTLNSYEVPFGAIIRTRASELEQGRLIGEIEQLANQLIVLIQTASHRTCFSCIQSAPAPFESVFEQLVYDFEYSEIITDDGNLYAQLVEYVPKNLPQKQLRLYHDETLSLSKLYSLESKMDTAFNRHIWLKSGGYLIIEPTEALTVIDVNSGKFDKIQASDEAYEMINREAAEEIALQIRLRNCSGIIIIDFINLKSPSKNDSLMEYLRELLKKDRVPARVVDMTPLGLVEITRKKQNMTLAEQFKVKR